MSKGMKGGVQAEVGSLHLLRDHELLKANLFLLNPMPVGWRKKTQLITLKNMEDCTIRKYSF
jgi:hypothetical protein